MSSRRTNETHGLPAYVTETHEGTVVSVYVQPGAATDRLVGVHGPALKIKVRAAAREGLANAALEVFLAKLLDSPRRRIAIVSGASSRNKKVLVAGRSPAEVAAAVGAVLSSRAHEPGQEARKGEVDGG